MRRRILKIGKKLKRALEFTFKLVQNWFYPRIGLKANSKPVLLTRLVSSRTDLFKARN